MTACDSDDVLEKPIQREREVWASLWFTRQNTHTAQGNVHAWFSLSCRLVWRAVRLSGQKNKSNQSFLFPRDPEENRAPSTAVVVVIGGCFSVKRTHPAETCSALRVGATHQPGNFALSSVGRVGWRDEGRALHRTIQRMRCSHEQKQKPELWTKGWGNGGVSLGGARVLIQNKKTHSKQVLSHEFVLHALLTNFHRPCCPC